MDYDTTTALWRARSLIDPVRLRVMMDEGHHLADARADHRIPGIAQIATGWALVKEVMAILQGQNTSPRHISFSGNRGEALR